MKHLVNTSQMIIGIDPAKPGGEGMTLVCLKKREGKDVEIVWSKPQFWIMAPEGCLEVSEERME